MSSYHYDNYANDDNIENVDFNRESMLGDIPNPEVTNPVNGEVNLELDQEVNEWLKEIVEEELAPDNTEQSRTEEPANVSIDSVQEQFQDYYDDFPEQVQEPNPQWYEEVLQNKIKETKKRLKNLSDFACYVSAATRLQITRMEKDHNSNFCKLDPPRHPPLSQPWQNYWRFNCVKKCKEDPDPPPYHAHTVDCEIVELEHVGTGITTRSKNILSCEFPKYLMDTVELFQIFAKESSKVNLNDDHIPDSVFEKPDWQYIKIRSNYKGEIMLLACGKGITPALKDLQTFFRSGPGRACNVVSLYCINIKWSQKKSIFPPTFLTGCLELRDKVGPITIYYNPKTNISFNSIEAVGLGKIMLEYLEPTPETTVIDIGCNIGALSLMLAQKSDKVVGLSTLDHEIKSAEQVMKHNTIHNVSFICCAPREVKIKVSSYVKKCISVAMVNLNTPFGKVKECCEVMTALRELPTLWRIAVYGSFSFDHRKCIERLTSANNDSEFLPMRGCILDKSPSIPNAFDIIILFERKSLIEPKIELIAPGPTVNIKSDSCTSESIKHERFLGPKPFLKCGRPSKKFGRFDSPMLPIERDVKPKLPPPPKEILDFTAPPPPLPPKPVIKEDKTHNFSNKEKPHRPSVIDMLNVKELKRRFDSPSLPISSPKTTNTSLRNQEINVNGSKESTNLINRNSDQMQDSPTLSNLSEKICTPWHKPVGIPPPDQQTIQPGSSTSSGLIRVKNVHELKFSPQLDLLNEPVNPILQKNNQHIQNSAVKKESQFSSLTIKNEEKINDSTKQKPFEKRPSSVEREDGELSDSEDNSTFPDAVLKPEPMDLDTDNDESDFSSITSSNVKEKITENNSTSSLSCIKNESIDFNEFSIKPINIKSEPIDIIEDNELAISIESHRLTIKPDPDSTNTSELQINPEVEISRPLNFSRLRVKPELGSFRVKPEPLEDDNQSLEEASENNSSIGMTIKSEMSSLPEMDDIENMETPIHNPAALNRQHLPTPPPSASTFDGFEFEVKPNMSFLTAGKEPEKQINKVKKETVEPENDQNVRNQENDEEEITIISVKQNAINDKARKNIKLEGTASTETENFSSKVNVDDNLTDDLQKLLERRQKLQKQLEGNIDSEKPKRRFKRSPSYGRRSPSYGRHSPSRNRRSPYSPADWRSKSRYSPDAVRRRRDRSPGSSNWNRGGRSPSSDRYREKRYRSPISPIRRSYRKNLSPDSPDRFSRKRYQSPDIYEKLYGTSRPRSKRSRPSESPERPRYKKNRSPISPVNTWSRRNKSPPSFERNWSYRNKSPPAFSKNWDKRQTSRSPKRSSRSQSRSSSPSERRRGRSPASPLSPPAKYSRTNKSPVEGRSTKSPSPSLSTASKTSHDNKLSDSKKKKKKKKKSSKSPRRSQSKEKRKKRSSSKSDKKSVDVSLDIASTEDSPKNLEQQATVELPIKISLPTTVA